MNNLNNFVFEGHLYQDANEHNERSYFKVAVNRSYRDAKAKTGWSTITTDIPCRLSGALAKSLHSKLTKGSNVKIIGLVNTYAGPEVTNAKGSKYKQPMFIVDVSQIGVTQKSGTQSSVAEQSEPEDEPPF